MDFEALFAPMMESVKDMMLEMIVISLPYIMGILALTIVLPWGLNFIHDLIFGKSASPYMEQELSFGQAFYDEDGNLDAVGYGDMSDYYGGDYDDPDADSDEWYYPGGGTEEEWQEAIESTFDEHWNGEEWENDIDPDYTDDDDPNDIENYDIGFYEYELLHRNDDIMFDDDHGEPSDNDDDDGYDDDE